MQIYEIKTAVQNFFEAFLLKKSLRDMFLL